MTSPKTCSPRSLFLVWLVMATTTGCGGSDSATADLTSRDLGADVPCPLEGCPETCEIASCSLGTGATDDMGERSCTEDLPEPHLPFAAGQHMGISRGPRCGAHRGKLLEAFDFDITASYESAHDMVAIAASAGKVVSVVKNVAGGCVDCVDDSYNDGWGNCVLIQLDGKCVYERYCHLRYETVRVKVGDHVCPGQALGGIGSTGNSGRSAGDYLHFQRELADGRSLLIPRFAEAAVPSGCAPCSTDTSDAGCFESRNTEIIGCRVGCSTDAGCSTCEVCRAGTCVSVTEGCPGVCGDGVCNSDEDPKTCSSDCEPVFVAQERLSRTTYGGCGSTGTGWHSAGGIVYWTFATSCPLPSLQAPGAYGTEFGRWRRRIRKAGRYRIGVKVPPRVAACNVPESAYSTGVRYILIPPNAAPIAATPVNQRSNIDSEATVFEEQWLDVGESALYIYDTVTDLVNCCGCKTQLRVFFDYANYYWLGP